MKKFSLISLISFLALICTLIPLSSSCASGPAAETQTLKIGLVTSITGPMSAAFKGLYDAIKPLNDLYNNAGGITVGGKKYLIDIVAEDDQSSPAGGVSAANKLVQAGVKFMLNPVFPPVQLAITPVANAAKVLSFTPSGSSPAIYTAENHYTFNCYADAYDVYPNYNYIQKNYPNVKKVAIVRPDDPAADFVESLLETELPKRGIEIVAKERYGMDTQDFYPVISKVMANKPDAIELIVCIPPWTAGITNTARDMGFTGPISACASAGDMNITNAMIKPGNNYDVFTAAIDPLSDKLPSKTRDFRKLVEKATGQPFSFDNFMPLNALAPALQGIVKAQSFDPDKVVTALENMEVDSPWGGKGKWKGQEWGFQHMLTTDTFALTKIAKGGKVEFEYLPR